MCSIGHASNTLLNMQGGKGGGKQKQQKQSAIPQAGAAVLPWRRPEVIMHNLLLVESFSRIVGRSVNAICTADSSQLDHQLAKDVLLTGRSLPGALLQGSRKWT